MDEFDAFNQTPQVPEEENTNIQEDASFGFGAGLDNTTDAAPAINTSSNDQREDHSWVIENVKAQSIFIINKYFFSIFN